MNLPFYREVYWWDQGVIQHRGYAVVCLSPVIEAFGVTSITPNGVMLITPNASIQVLRLGGT